MMIVSSLAQENVDPELDLVLERVVDVSAKHIWAAWTQPELLKPWFAPKPWTTTECEIDLRPGGIFRTVMKSPEGELYPGTGCYLEVIPEKRLTWTNVLLPGFRPAEESSLPFTAVLLLEPQAQGTKYVVHAMHRDPDVRKRHDGMGFHQGWGMCLDQLVEMVKGR
jgi:uncharacterized protein YndB with AHSA1/START domain